MDAVDAVNAIDEEDEDEDEGDLHPVLNFGDDGALGDEARRERQITALEEIEGGLNGNHIREEFALDGVGKGKDEEHEHCHLSH